MSKLKEKKPPRVLILFPTGDGAGAAQDTGDAVSALEKLTVFLKRQVWSRKEHSLGVQMWTGASAAPCMG